MVQQRKFRLSDMLPNAWFYKLRDMGAQGRGGAGRLHRSSSARCYREILVPPSWRRGSSARWNRDVDVQQPPPSLSNRQVDKKRAEVVDLPVTPTNGSSHSPLPRRASYYYSTRDREVPRPPKAKDAQSPSRSSRRRNRAGHAPEGRRQVPALVPVIGKEPVLDVPESSCRRRDMCIKNAGGEPRKAMVTGTPTGGLDVKVITSEKEIIIDLRDEATQKRRLRPIVTRPVRRQPEPHEPDGSHVADVTVRDKDSPERKLNQIVTRPARWQPEPHQPDGSHVDLADVTVQDKDDKDSTERKLNPIMTMPARRQPEPEPDGHHADVADVTARASSASAKSGGSKPRRSSASSSSGRLRLKTRVKSPRLLANARRGKPPARNWMPPVIAESYAVVMTTRDPRNDFQESMEEMIRAKGIRRASDLEDLLACYLSLNDAEHHDLIIEVFEQIWMSLANAKP